MENFYFKKIGEMKRTKTELEKKLNVSIKIDRGKVTITGDPLDEYEASLVLNAMNFGFSAQSALSLKQEDTIFQVINIKDISRKKKLKEVRARVIGKHGKTKKTIENITGYEMIINENDIGIIGSAEKIDEVITAISSLVRGTKQSNTYRYLEKMNKKKAQNFK